MEIILALGIFLLLSAVVIDIFFSSGREQRRGVSRQQVVASARAALELIAKDIRLGGVPLYPIYGPAPGYEAYPWLAIRFPDNSMTWYLGFPGIFDSRLVTCHLPPNTSGCNVPEPLTSERAEVESFKVFVTPVTDPFTFTATENKQPTITVSLTMKGKSSLRPEEQMKTTLQTTVVPRIYAR